MAQVASDVRKLVYTVICFQCLLQLTTGSAYQKYLKLFSYLLTLTICCNIIFSFVGKFESSIQQADVLYESWLEEWQKYSIDEEERNVREMAEWYKKTLGE